MLPSKQIRALNSRIISCAITVHRQLGPGLLESVYEDALCVELEYARLKFQQQVSVPIFYRGRKLGNPLKLDLLVADEVVVELKSVETILPVHEAQLLSYLRLAEKDVGLLINFHSVVLKDGIRRKIRNQKLLAEFAAQDSVLKSPASEAPGPTLKTHLKPSP